MLAVLGLPQLIREGHCQVVLADVLLNLYHKRAGGLSCGCNVLFSCHVFTVLGLPQLVCESHCQVVLADVLLNLITQVLLRASC